MYITVFHNLGKRKPLLIVHGWPGSIFEFHKLIPMLTNPSKYGGRDEDALEIVAPSIPGYGFSEAAHKPGIMKFACFCVITFMHLDICLYNLQCYKIIPLHILFFNPNTCTYFEILSI